MRAGPLPPGAPFDDFAAEVRVFFAQHVAGIRGDRDPHPMLVLDTPLGVTGLVMEPEWFATAEDKLRLIAQIVLPAIRQYRATKVAWLHAGTMSTELVAAGGKALADPPAVDESVLVATIIDAEVHQVWIARMVEVEATEDIGPVAQVPSARLSRNVSRAAGEWEQLTPNEQLGLLVTPVQEALR